MAGTYNMHEAKTHLSRLAERAARGEEIVIARNGRPLARLVAIEKRRARTLGLWRGQLQVGEDFDDPLPWQLQRRFEGRDA
jgi:prevent-host-death family protein